MYHVWIVIEKNWISLLNLIKIDHCLSDTVFTLFLTLLKTNICSSSDVYQVSQTFYTIFAGKIYSTHISVSCYPISLPHNVIRANCQHKFTFQLMIERWIIESWHVGGIKEPRNRNRKIVQKNDNNVGMFHVIPYYVYTYWLDNRTQ